MEIPKTELFAVLQEFNPWWSGQPITDLPAWLRSVGAQVWRLVEDTQLRRMLLLSGARQVGKTTIFRQTIKRLLDEGYPASNIIYATFDHTILKLAGIERTPGRSSIRRRPNIRGCCFSTRSSSSTAGKPGSSIRLTSGAAIASPPPVRRPR